jgi:hypothetical protein
MWRCDPVLDTDGLLLGPQAKLYVLFNIRKTEPNTKPYLGLKWKFKLARLAGKQLLHVVAYWRSCLETHSDFARCYEPTNRLAEFPETN